MKALDVASTLAPAGAAPTPQYFIPAVASLQERKPRTLKHDDTFALCDHNGDMIGGPGSSEGLFYRDTRYLSHLYLTVNGARPMLLSSHLRDDNSALVCDLSNPDLLDADGKREIKHDRIHFRRVRLLHDAAAYERIAIRNFDDGVRKLRIDIGFGSDFADLFEVRGAVRPRRGTYRPAEVSLDAVTLSYTGLDHKKRQTQVHFEPQPTLISNEHATYEFDLAPGEARVIFVQIACGGRLPELQSPARAFFRALRNARRESRALCMQAAAVATSNQIFNEAIRRNVADLYMLTTRTADGLFPYAGIPWFSTAFGRDSIITAMMTLWLDPAIAMGVLKHLAALQATTVDEVADSEPGKILHELRYGEMAELGEVPFRRYYGSIDSTPLFIMLAGAYLERTDDIATIHNLWPSIEAALTWIDDYGDRDGDGFVEYHRQTDSGLANQGWKDSADSVSHRDGALAKGPIALVEVQAYVYGAWKAASDMLRRLGHDERARSVAARAEDLQQRFDAAFYDAALGTYVLALDGEKRPCRVRSSNAGHALFTGIALPSRAAAVAGTLMESFTGFGIRTLAIGEVRYNPMSYHNGSVWPHDNAMIASGFARYGLRRQTAQIFEGLFAASTYTDLRRLPELLCGFPRQRNSGPVSYPVACAPQAWATAAPFMLLQSCLGLSFTPRDKLIAFHKPVLPAFLEDVLLTGLVVGDCKADVNVRRAGADAIVSVVKRHGECQIATSL